MEITMRTMLTGACGLLASVLSAALLACGAAKADVVPPIKGNDTGGIIAYSLAPPHQIREIAFNHCARYGKIAKVTGVQPYYGGYLSFACIWVPSGSERPLRVRY
jgi:hypothetical protein